MTGLQLRDAFLEDHRALTRGLTRLVQALQQNDVALAVQLAEQLDRTVGAHMEFEEHVFYPELEKVLGAEFVSRLYHEHELGQGAVRSLVAHDPGAPIDEDQRTELIGQLQTALEHALGCGTLLSHVAALDADAQAAMHAQLLAIRNTGTRWSTLVHRPLHKSASE
jgi:hypothetical protein